MKHVDIELLTKEIDSLYDKWCGNSTGLEVGEEGASIGAVESCFEEIRKIIDSLQQEQLEIDLNDFTQKMDDWKARYSHPDNIPIKATMAFTARMFYMYPNVAREWYDSLPKATMD